MKSVVKSVQLIDNVVIVVTKSNVVKSYTLKSKQVAVKFVNDLMSWQLVIQTSRRIQVNVIY